MGWAVTNWNILEGRYVRDNLMGSGPLLGYSPTLFLSYVECIVREFASEHMDDLYTPVEKIVDRRVNDIQAAMEAFA